MKRWKLAGKPMRRAPLLRFQIVMIAPAHRLKIMKKPKKTFDMKRFLSLFSISSSNSLRNVRGKSKHQPQTSTANINRKHQPQTSTANIHSKTMKKIPLTLLLSGIAVFQANAALLFTDDFNRANTGFTSNGTTMGSASYVITSKAQFDPTYLQILGNAATSCQQIGPAWSVLSYQGFALNSGNFTVSAVLKTTTALTGAENWGVAFNFQDYNDFYWARVSTDTQLQVGKFVNGAVSVLAYITLTEAVASNTPYTLTVSSTEAYKFNVSLVGGTLNYSGNITDSGSSFTGGYGGALWGTTHNSLLVDGLSIATVPEPATWALLAFSLTTMVVLRRNHRHS